MKITNAMYLISSSKLRKARKITRTFRLLQPHADTMSRIACPICRRSRCTRSSTTATTRNPRRAYLVLTADKGMAGAYNQNVLKQAEQLRRDPERPLLCGRSEWVPRPAHGDPRLVEEFRTAPATPRVAACARHHGGRHRRLQVRQDLDAVYLIYTKIQNALTS